LIFFVNLAGLHAPAYNDTRKSADSQYRREVSFFPMQKRRSVIEWIRATPHNSARANPEKIWVLMMALFRRNTLCIARKSDEIRAQIFQEAPK
jgi:hypothetical protein